MTTPTEDHTTGPKIPDKVLSIELPPTGTGVRAARRAARAQGDGSSPDGKEGAPTDGGVERARPPRSFLVMFASALVVCTLLAAVLALMGVRTLRDSTAGRTVVSAEPDEPGFEGFLEPTPTLVVFDVRDGALQSAALIALRSGDAGGSVVLIPPSTNVGGMLPLALPFTLGAPVDDMREQAEAIVDIGITEAVSLDAAKWADLVAPVAPITVVNPDAIEGFDAGPIELGPEDAARWLGTPDEGEDELARLFRYQLFWEAWLDAIAEAGSAAAVPGEVDSGIGRFIRGLASGGSSVATLPVVASSEAEGPTTYEVDREAAQDLLATAVPYPIGTWGAPRTLVRLLDGTGDPNHVATVAPQVVRAQSSIVVVGNADHFDYVETEIRYHQPEHREAAEQIREQLGAGRIIEDVRPIDSFGVTIVLGTDT